jgi:hypothetical protein
MIMHVTETTSAYRPTLLAFFEVDTTGDQDDNQNDQNNDGGNNSHHLHVFPPKGFGLRLKTLRLRLRLTLTLVFRVMMRV